MSHYAFFVFSLPLLLFIILFCQLLFHPDLEASLRGHSPHLCPFPRCIQRRMCGRSPSLGPRSSPPGSGGGSGSGMWICSLRGHKGQTNRHRRLTIYCPYQPPVRSDGNSALFSQNTSGKYNLSSLRQSLKLGFSHLAMVFNLPTGSCALWAASENHSRFANCWLMTGSFRQLYTKSWGSKGGHNQQKHDYCILTKKKHFCPGAEAPGCVCYSLVQRRLCLYRPQMKSPHRSHHVGWAWLQGWKLCPSPFSSVIGGSWMLLRTLMMPTLLSRSGTFPGLILRALALSRRGGEHGKLVRFTCSRPDLRSRSSINSPQDIASLKVRLSPNITGKKRYHDAVR